MVVVAEPPAAEASGRSTRILIEALGKAGAFPIIEARWTDAPAALQAIEPAALLLADAVPSERAMRALRKALETGPLLTPVLTLGDEVTALPQALPIAADEPADRVIARLRSVLRIRTLHATVLRRSGAEAPHASRALAVPDLLDQSTVLCLGRGRSYPALSVAVGERVGLIGALSVETAARYLNARDIEGVVIGDGFGARVVEALLTVLAEDSRFRNLPVGLLGGTAYQVDEEQLPNLVRGDGDPLRLVERLLPYVRLQAFESHLKRVLQSLTSDGVVDPETGLLSREAFWRDLDRAVGDAEQAGACLSLARFSFDDGGDRRISVDAARLLSRLVRDVDFACREQDGSILLAFNETDLRSAHVVARRIAAVLKHTMLAPEREQRAIRPNVTLATLKPADDLDALAKRVGAHRRLAAVGPAA
jgi:GGDEF domain-containing protein